MNELIKELAEQAGSTHKQNLGVYQFFTDELENFAELIVLECVKCLNPLSRNHSMVGAAQDTIREHFGVEE